MTEVTRILSAVKHGDPAAAKARMRPRSASPCGTRTSGARRPRSVSPAETSPFGKDGRVVSARTVDVA
jgi:hypothetical protein